MKLLTPDELQLSNPVTSVAHSNACHMSQSCIGKIQVNLPKATVCLQISSSLGSHFNIESANVKRNEVNCIA